MHGFLHMFSNASRVVLASSVVAIPIMTTYVFIQICALVAGGWWLSVMIGALVGAMAIDFLTGIVHWACDRFGDPTTPVLGRSLIASFRDHHVNPTGIIDHDWIETNGQASFFALIALFVVAASIPSVNSWVGAIAATTLATMAALGAWANQIHKWAHMTDAPRCARALQNIGLALHPDDHAYHHRAPHDRGYCISTGWMNPVLDRLGLWSWLERSLRRTT